MARAAATSRLFLGLGLAFAATYQLATLVVVTPAQSGDGNQAPIFPRTIIHKQQDDREEHRKPNGDDIRLTRVLTNTVVTTTSTEKTLCEEVLENFDSFAPYQINKFRRQLYHSACPQAETLRNKFIDFALSRENLPIYYHHIPKSAGSHMCVLAEASFGERSPTIRRPNDCNLIGLKPRWAGQAAKFWTCEDITQKVKQDNLYFFANERFLDYQDSESTFFCDSFRYVITLRETVSRVKAHFNHMRKKWLSSHPLALNNYLTWALVTSKMADHDHEYNPKINGIWPTIPEPSWLSHAEEALYGYDFVLSMKAGDQACVDSALKFLGFSSEMQSTERTNVATLRNGTKTYLYQYDEAIIVQHNQMDMRLFQMAQSIMQADCDFARDLLLRKKSGAIRANATAVASK